MTPFYVAGGVLATWALIVTALGVRSHSFPSSKGAERVVAAISAVLVAAAIGTGVVTAANEGEGDEAHGAEGAELHEPGAGAGAGEAGELGGDEAGGEAAEAGGEAEGVGDESVPTDVAGPGALELSAAPSGALEFDEEQLDADRGPVTIVMRNPSPIPHNVALEGNGVDEVGEIVGEGETSTVTAELEPGEYTFYCSVAGHREAGMEGTLSVE